MGSGLMSESYEYSAVTAGDRGRRKQPDQQAEQERQGPCETELPVDRATGSSWPRQTFGAGGSGTSDPVPAEKSQEKLALDIVANRL